jgi:anti-sigma factor RsiW
MNECMEREIREMLPDVLHGTLVPGERARIEKHLATCDQCRQELEVLRLVHGAAVFAPSIDVERVVRQIPPHGIITPVVERPAPSRRMVGWLVAASVAFVVAGGGSVFMRQADRVEAPPVVVVPGVQGLALASGVEGLSDGVLVQLMNEMSDFDALPAAELEPVFAVDTIGGSEQDSL